MAVAVDAVSTALNWTVANSGTTASTTMTVAGTATLAVAFVEAGLSASADTNITGYGTFTLGGTSFTQLGSAKKQSGSDADTSGYVDLWYIISPPTGAAKTFTATPTYTGAAAQLCARMVCVTYTGTATSSPFGTPQRNNGKLVASLAKSDTLASGDMLVGLCGNGTAAPTVGTGTQDATVTGSVNTAADNINVAHNTGTGTVTISWNTNSGDWSGLSIVKILVGGGFIAPKPTVVPQSLKRASYY